MRKNIRENYDANNSMENYKNEEKRNKKSKKHDKKTKKIGNILDEIKKEDLKERVEILNEINNTMLRDNEDDNKINDMPKKNIENQKPKHKKKKENENKEIKEKKEKNKKKIIKNNLSETINEINNELNEQYYLDMENIFEVNTKFNYPRTSPFLYIREDNSENDLFPNPLSTMDIKNLLKSKTIKPFLIKVKPIDIFTMKNYPEFSYFDFNEILTKNWSKNLEYSSIFLDEYKNLNEKNIIKNLEDKNKALKISKDYFAYQASEKKKNNKMDNIINKKNNDMTLDLNFSISQIDKTGINDLSMSIIKQLQNVKLTQKQVNQITSIIEEVEEDEWTEIKNKKKEKESIPFIGIVGLNESRQVIENNTSQNNKKNKKRKNKNKKFVNMSNNQFAGLKINYSSDEENDI